MSIFANVELTRDLTFGFFLVFVAFCAFAFASTAAALVHFFASFSFFLAF